MAKELKYTISGDARDFTRTMQSIDKRLAASERNAHGFSRGLASAFHGIGSAASVAGAAVATGLVLEVKSAVTQFQESNKVARQTQAVLKSTGGAANVTAKEISNLATALSRKTGIDDEVVQSGENMLLTFRNIRNEAGKGNDIFNQSTKVLLDMSTALGQDSTKSAIQLGKALNDPIKGITALRRVGVSFTEQQQKQIDTLVKSGRTLDAQKLILRELTKEFGGSAVAQATSTEKLKVAFGNLQEDIGSGLAPAVDAISNKLTRFAIDVEPKVIRAADRIAKTFGRKDLSLDQKFRLSYDQARAVFKPLVDEAQASIGKMHLGDKLSAAVSLAIPKILDVFAAHAPKAAETFVKAFIGANVWTRLFAVGWLLKKTGGLSAFRTVGATAAAETAAGYAVGGAGRGVAAGATAGVAASAGSKLLTAGRGLAAGAVAGFGGPLAISAALILGPEAVKVFFHGSKSVQTMLEETDKKAKAAANGSFPAYRHQLQLAADEAARFGAKGRKTADAIEEMAQRVENSVGSKWIGSIRSSWKQFEDAGGHGVKATRAVVERNMGIIRDRIGTDTDAGRRAMASNFKQAAAAVKKQMDAAGGSTKQGTHQIRAYLVDALKALGLTSGQAGARVDNGTLQSGSARVPGQGLAPSRAAGGWIGQRGQRGGDNIPIVVGAGEAVLNRHQQAVIEGFMGGGFLDKLFSTVRTPHYMAQGGRVRPVGMDTPSLRYASGGVIPHVTVNVGGGAGAVAQRAVNIDRSEAQRIYNSRAAAIDTGGGGGGGGSTTGLAPQVKRALAWARAHGWSGGVTSGFRSRAKQQYLWDHRGSNPNPVAPPGTSMHERGLAVDVSDITGFQQAMSSAPPNSRLIWFGPGDPVHFSTTGHARGGRARRFASGGRVLSHTALERLWIQAGGSPAKSDLMAAIAQAESGGDVNAHNPSGASGLWQILGQEIPGNIKDPLTNARNAVWKLKHQGLGAWVAYTNGAYGQFLTGANATGKGLSVRQGPKAVTRLDRIQAALAEATLTPGRKDDRAAQYQLINLYHQQITRARRRNDPAALSDAIQNYSQAREDYKQLWPASSYLGPVAKTNFAIQRAQAPWDQQDTDQQNSLIVSGVDPSSAQGLGVQALGAQTRLMALQAQRRQLVKARNRAKREGNAAGVRHANTAIKAIDSQILAQRASITTLGQSYAEATAPVAPDASEADTSLADAINAATEQQKAFQDSIDALNATMTDNNRIRQETNTSQNGVVAGWIADLVGGRLGTAVGLGVQTPGFAGSRSRY